MVPFHVYCCRIDHRGSFLELSLTIADKSCSKDLCHIGQHRKTLPLGWVQPHCSFILRCIQTIESMHILPHVRIYMDRVHIDKLVMCQHADALATRETVENAHFSTIGMTNAAVFPEPVLAIPTTSIPCKIKGIVFRWMGVGREYPFLLMAFNKGILSPIVSAPHHQRLLQRSFESQFNTIRIFMISWIQLFWDNRRVELRFKRLLSQNKYIHDIITSKIEIGHTMEDVHTGNTASDPQQPEFEF